MKIHYTMLSATEIALTVEDMDTTMSAEQLDCKLNSFLVNLGILAYELVFVMKDTYGYEIN